MIDEILKNMNGLKTDLFGKDFLLTWNPKTSTIK